MYSTNKFRLYPTQEQVVKLELTLQGTRFVYNHFLQKWLISLKESGRRLELASCSRELTEMKKMPEMIWLREVDSTALQATIRHLSDTFTAYHRYRIKVPRYKTDEDYYQRFVSKQISNNIKIQDDCIRLPKIGYIKFKQTRDIVGKISYVTVTREATGQWYISITIPKEAYYRKPREKIIGIVPTKEGGYYLSTGRWIRNKHVQPELQAKLEYEETKLQLMKKKCHQKGHLLSKASNYQKQKRKVARLYSRIDCQREDFLHKLTTKLVFKYETIVVAKVGRRMLPSIYTDDKSIESWDRFVEKVIYKSKYYCRAPHDYFLPKSIQSKSYKEQALWLIAKVEAEKQENLINTH